MSTTVGNTTANQISECICCNVKLPNPNAIKGHFSSKKHLKKWSQYVQENQNKSALSKTESSQEKDKNVVPLVNHNIQRASTVPDNAQANVGKYAGPVPNFFTIDSAKLLLDTKTTLPTDSPKKAQLYPDNSSKSHQNVSNLRAQIFTELEKLVQTLYYSKKLPDQVSLDYIKRINQEVQILIKKHAKSDSVLTSKALTATNTINKTETKQVKSPDAVTALLITQKDKIKTNEEKPQVQAKSATQVKPLTEIKPPEKPLQKPQTSQQDTPFSSLLTEIVDEKRRLQKTGNWNNANELEVLNEIEILLLQISKPKLPHQEILDCLKDFNKIIDLDCIKKSSCQPCIGM